MSSTHLKTSISFIQPVFEETSNKTSKSNSYSAILPQKTIENIKKTQGTFLTAPNINSSFMSSFTHINTEKNINKTPAFNQMQIDSKSDTISYTTDAVIKDDFKNSNLSHDVIMKEKSINKNNTTFSYKINNEIKNISHTEYTANSSKPNNTIYLPGNAHNILEIAKVSANTNTSVSNKIPSDSSTPLNKSSQTNLKYVETKETEDLILLQHKPNTSSYVLTSISGLLDNKNTGPDKSNKKEFMPLFEKEKNRDDENTSIQFEENKMDKVIKQHQNKNETIEESLKKIEENNLESHKKVKLLQNYKNISNTEKNKYDDMQHSEESELDRNKEFDKAVRKKNEERSEDINSYKIKPMLEDVTFTLNKENKNENNNKSSESRTIKEFAKQETNGQKENELSEEKAQVKKGIEREEEDKGQDDHTPLPPFRKPFDQHSRNELKSLSWDHNKESMQVTSGMETTSRVGSGDDLPESYVPIFWPKKHYLQKTNINSDKNKYQNETLEQNNESGTFQSELSSSKNFSDVGSLFHSKDNINLTSFNNSKIVSSISNNTYANNQNKKIIPNLTTTKSVVSFSSELFEDTHLRKNDSNRMEIIGKKFQSNKKEVYCSCICPCKNFSSENQTYLNSLSGVKNGLSQDKQKAKKIVENDEDQERIRGTTKVIEEKLDQINSEGNPSSELFNSTNQSIKSAAKETVDNKEKLPIQTSDEITNSSHHKHRHRHGNQLVEESKEERCKETTLNDLRDSPCSSSYPYSTTRGNKLASITTEPPLQMSNQKRVKSSSKEKRDRKANNSDGDCNHDSRMCKLKRKRERDKCSLGKKGCSAKKIAEYYLKLFGAKKTDSSQFYIVPIYYGREIDHTSWNWKAFLDGSLEFTSPNTGGSLASN